MTLSGIDGRHGSREMVRLLGQTPGARFAAKVSGDACIGVIEYRDGSWGSTAGRIECKHAKTVSPLHSQQWPGCSSGTRDLANLHVLV